MENLDKDRFMVLVGNNLRRFRKENHLTQNQFAEKVDISVSHIANIENGKKCMSSYVLRKITDTFSINADILLKEPTTDNRLANINALLNGKSEEFIFAVESFIEIFSEKLSKKIL